MGATAAAVLLERHGQAFSGFGLKPAAGSFPRPYMRGYRFATPDAQEQVWQWWQQEQTEPK